MSQCTAHSKRSGEQCRKASVPGRKVCAMHGGKSLAGPASPAFQHGRYSRYLPARLAERYHEAVNDPELLALREDIALVDARLSDLLVRTQAGESAALWKELQAAHKEFVRARRRGDVDGMKPPLAEMEELIERGLIDQTGWDEVIKLLEQRRKLVESEQKRLVAMQQMISSEQAMLLLAAVADVIRRHVHDRKILAALSDDIARLVVANPGRIDPAG